MVQLQAQGYNEKEVLNLKLEAQKLDDLEFRKSQTFPGPFSNINEVQSFMDAVPDSKVKNGRMYREVRFQRNSSTALKRDAVVFRLKCAHKNLETIDYATNLCKYIDQSKGVTLSMGDLRNVSNGLNGIVDVDNTPKDQSVTTAEEARNEVINYQCGEHVACIWADDVGNNIN